MNNSISLHDASERQRALDPTASFIIQAPAGSGKTELLTQRYLLLLGTVKQPEEILAITFTKKSAAEMRARIIKALKNANHDSEPEAAHDKQTWQLAQKALQRNMQLKWDLLDNPSRLQIQTIDSFNASLTRQLPLLSNFGAPLDIAEDPSLLYRAAVQEFLSHLEENVAWASAIEKLLLHMDNDLANVETLLINMLSKRDQWLHYIARNANIPQLREMLEQHLTNVNSDALEFLHEIFPEEDVTELVSLAQAAGHNVLRDNPTSPITLCAEITELPGTEITDKKYWLSLAKFLLTEEFQWRKSVTKNHGFPAPSEAKNAEVKSQLTHLKLRMKELLENLSQHEELRLAFKELSTLPEHFYEDKHWETLHALHDILRIVVAQLKIVFQEQGKIDFIENAQAALTALGTEEEPTDITLALDYKIQHILIDEFQDTSNSQYRLLEKLISGWQPYDGRTLFVVGDPMQSIYRFREAEVGLFIRARQKGIGNLLLEPLTLSVNFRSTAGVVNWVNDHFAKVLPAYEDIACGAVSYSPSKARQEDDTSITPVVLHTFINADENAQANAIIRVIHETRAQHAQAKIAILVRSRTHLRAIIPALKAANLPFRALDIEPLATRAVIQDLLALTRALLHPADRIAWLAILRAPWCGLTLSDLLVIAGDKNKPIVWEQLQSLQVKNQIAAESQLRLARLVNALTVTLASRRRYSLRRWVEYTWQQLGGPACLTQASDLEDANAFFKLLAKLDVAGDLPDFKQLNDAIHKLYAAPNSHANDLLQIMTIHNSKGLEFDTVILPHLERKASQDEKQLLQWMERTRHDETSNLILAPIHAIGEEKNLIYDYIKRQHNIRTDHENGRLLYVAATRTKKQLHIFFNLKSKENSQTEIKDPANNSLLQKLWPAVHNHIKSNICEATAIQTETSQLHSETIRKINRLTTQWKNPLTLNYFSEEFAIHQNTSGFHLIQNTAKHIGIVMHLMLQNISQHGIEWWISQDAISQQAFIKNHFLQLGMLTKDIPYAEATIEKAINRTLKDPRGQWILHPHNDAQSEFPLTTSTKNLVIDRTFVDENNIRWIIDYKSTDYSGDDLESFLAFEHSQYENQLREYHLAFKEIDQRPIRVGLYFPLISAWKEWSFEEVVCSKDE